MESFFKSDYNFNNFNFNFNINFKIINNPAVDLALNRDILYIISLSFKLDSTTFFNYFLIYFPI